MLALGGQLLFDDTPYGGGHVAALGHLFLHLGCREAEVVEDHQRLTSKTGDDAVGHVIDRLTRLLGLQLRKLQILSQLVKRQAEVLGLHGGLHQFHIVHGTMGGLAQFVEDIGSVQPLEGVCNTVGTLGHLDTLVHYLLDLSNGIRCHLANQFA